MTSYMSKSRDERLRRIFEIFPGFMTWTTLLGLVAVSVIRPLWAAELKSWLLVVCPYQGLLPPVVQVRLRLFSALPKDCAFAIPPNRSAPKHSTNPRSDRASGFGAVAPSVLASWHGFAVMPEAGNSKKSRTLRRPNGGVLRELKRWRASFIIFISSQLSSG